MQTEKAQNGRSDRNKDWIPLLKRELGILQPKKIIIVGKKNFDYLLKLDKEAFENAHYIIHYSPRNKKKVRDEFIKRKLADTKITNETLLSFHNTQLRSCSTFASVAHRSDEIKRLLSTKPLSDHHRMLISIYKQDFLSIHKSK